MKKFVTHFVMCLAINIVADVLMCGVRSFRTNRKQNKLIAETAVTEPEIASFLQNVKDGNFVSTTIKVQ